MLPLVDLVALTLLPPWRLRSILEGLKQGRSAIDILHEQCILRSRREGSFNAQDTSPGQLLDAAAAALTRGERANLRAVPWDDSTYPATLAATFDPPLVLWLRGNVDALSLPAV